MTNAQAAKLHVGDTVYNGSLKAAVEVTTDNFVKLRWMDRREPDILSRQSPFWRWLEPYK